MGGKEDRKKKKKKEKPKKLDMNQILQIKLFILPSNTYGITVLINNIFGHVIFLEPKSLSKPAIL